MRINETFEHEPLLTRQEESCPLNGCSKIGTQCVNVTAPLTLTPTASVGTVSVSCQGTPTITCAADESGTSCTVTMTQQVCVSVPIRYGVNLTSEEPTIACADNCIGVGCC